MSGLKTDVDFADSLVLQLNVVGWIFTGVAAVAVVLKLFGRFDKKLAGWDDFFIFFSMGLSIIATTFVSYSSSLGLGRHSIAVITEKGMEGYSKAAFWQVIAFPFNIGSFSFPNISIAILIVHLLEYNPLRANILYGMTILQVVLAMISVFLVFFQCKPTAMLWNPTLKGECWSPDVFNGFTYFVSAYTTVTDIVLAIVPITAFWNLQMRKSTKLSVSVMMGLTLLSAVVTIVKATYVHLFSDHTDPLYNVIPLVIWGMVEQNVVIIAACAPTLRPLFRKAFTATKDSSGATTSRLRSGSNFKMLSSANNADEWGGKFDPITTKDRDDDGGSRSSQRGILYSMEVTVDSENELHWQNRSAYR